MKEILQKVLTDKKTRSATTLAIIALAVAPSMPWQS